MDTQEFLNKYKDKAFLTSDASRAGITKSQLKKIPGVVRLSTIPQPQRRGQRMEGLWAYDFELEALTKKAKKVRKGSNTEETQSLVTQIEEMVRAKLGFNTKPVEDENAQKEEG